MGSPSPDRLAEITGGIAPASADIVKTPNPTSPRIRTNRKGFLQLGGALVGGLATGLGMIGGVSAQEVPPPADPDKPNPPFEMGEDEARVLALDTSKETNVSPDTSAGGETVETYPTTFPERFGDLERDGLLIINKGKKSGLAQGDPELYRNILWARDNYAEHPEIKRTIITYDSIKQMEASGVPFDAAHAVAWPWDAWSSSVTLVDGTRQKFPPTFTDGQIRWFVSPDNSMMEFHMTMPEARPGVTPHWSQLQVLSIPGNDSYLPIFRILFSSPENFFSTNYLKYSTDQGNKEDTDPLYQQIRLANPTEDGYRRARLPFYIVSK